ncbi:hypothetical protein KBJ94_23080 [Pseudomonas sp. ITA]|uniref:hypothetical protein n=1 Tax=Pseudomonas sp. ITA TaxID=2825841 RepID=UPI002496CA51|nr:hypothetical protein [Pseudomonas sp. ITA]MDI2144936.1 hypothetical protein [Pseudomonas sp. ITA]
MTNKSKLLVNLDCMFIGSHSEVVLVPADLTPADLHDIETMRFGTVNIGDYVIDTENGSKYNSHTEWVGDDEKHTLEIVRDPNRRMKILKEDTVASEPAKAAGSSGGLLFIQQDEDLHTIIAALRYWQKMGMCDPFKRSDDMHSLCTNNDELESYCDDDLDDLVMRLNVVMNPKDFLENIKAIV